MLKKLESQIRYLYGKVVAYPKDTTKMTMDDIIKSVKRWDWDTLLPLGKETHRLVTSYIWLKTGQ